MSLFRAATTANPVKVLAIGDSVRGDGTDPSLVIYDQELTERRRYALKLAAAGLAGKVVDAAIIVIDAAAGLPDNVSTIVNTVGGGILGLGLACDAYALREYARAAEYYQDVVAPGMERIATRPNLG